MHFDDFIARQLVKTNDSPASPHGDAQQPIRRLLGALWSGIRQVAWGIDAYSSVLHGIDVPPDHPARTQPGRRPLRAAPRRRQQT